MAGSLEFIKSATGSSVSSLSVTDCFSDKYDVYKIYIEGTTNSGEFWGDLNFIDSGGVDTTSNYDQATLHTRADSTFNRYSATSITKFERFGLYGLEGGSTVFQCYNPFDSSSFTFFTMQNSTVDTTPSNVGKGAKSIGVHTVAEQITGIQIAGGTYAQVDVKVYGVK